MPAAPRPNRTIRRAGVAAAIGFIAIAIFELVLAAGAPLGHAAYGGAHAHLSTAQRIASGVAVLVWTGAALIALGRAGLWSAGRPGHLFQWGAWLLVAVNILAALANFASHSRSENLIFGPLALILAVLCAMLARGGASRRPSRRQTGAPTVSSAPR
jgi:hypothetical protein